MTCNNTNWTFLEKKTVSKRNLLLVFTENHAKRVQLFVNLKKVLFFEWLWFHRKVIFFLNFAVSCTSNWFFRILPAIKKLKPISSFLNIFLRGLPEGLFYPYIAEHALSNSARGAILTLLNFYHHQQQKT